jgi:hypothetical protein
LVRDRSMREGGIYTIEHAAAAPSSLTLELLG